MRLYKSKHLFFLIESINLSKQRDLCAHLFYAEELMANMNRPPIIELGPNNTAVMPILKQLFYPQRRLP
jgi:hypothetical protein